MKVRPDHASLEASAARNRLWDELKAGLPQQEETQEEMIRRIVREELQKAGVI